MTVPATAARVSEVVEEPVTPRTREGCSHHDEGGVQVVTAPSLRLIDVDVRRLRPNVLIDCGGDGLIEDSWIGAGLRLGHSSG